MKKMLMFCMLFFAPVQALFYSHAQKARLQKCMAQYQEDLQKQLNVLEHKTSMHNGHESTSTQELKNMLAQKSYNHHTGSLKRAFTYCLNEAQKKR